MRLMKFVRPMVFLSALALATPVVAQSITTSDIQRLQDQVYDASNEVSRLRSRDQGLADRLQAQLDDLRDEVVYLRVKLRKEGSVNRNDYNEVRSGVDNIRAQARGESARQGSGNWSTGGSGSGSGTGTGAYGTGSGSGSGSGTGAYDPQSTRNAPTRRNEIPSGQEIDVRMERELSSATAQVEDRFTATTVVDLYQGNDVLIPAGSTMRGVVSSVNKATRTDRKGSLTVAFDQVTIRGRAYPMRGTVTQALESEGITRCFASASSNRSSSGSDVFQGGAGRPDCLLHVAFRVGAGKEPRFELRRGRIDAARQHPPEELPIHRRIRLHRRLEVAHRRGREERRHQRAECIDLHGDAGVPRGIREPGCEVRSEPRKMAVQL